MTELAYAKLSSVRMPGAAPVASTRDRSRRSAMRPASWSLVPVVLHVAHMDAGTRASPVNLLESKMFGLDRVWPDTGLPTVVK